MKYHLIMTALACAGISLPAMAQETNLDAQVQELRKEVDAIKAQAKPPDDFLMKAGGNTLKLGGYVQADARYFNGGKPGYDTFTIRRARVDMQGSLHDNFGYDLQVDVANSPKTINAWVEYREFQHLRLRVGQQKEPFSAEEITSGAWLDFLERSMVVTAFAPQEDVGALLYGACWDKRIEYSLGAFNGRGKNQDDNNNDKDVAGRLVVSPVDGLFVGVNGTVGQQNDTLNNAQANLKTDAKTTFYTFSPNASEDGTRTRVGTDIEWYLGPASLKAEWIQTDLNGLSTSNATADATFDGWYVGGTYLLTGEKKLRNKSVEPAHPFSAKSGGAGAWEVAARYEVLNGDQGLIDNGMAKGTDQADGFLLGVNWYPNANVKLALNYEHMNFADDITVNGDEISSEDAALLRFQYSL